MEYIHISTTQNIDIDFEVASIGERILAALIDYLIFFVYFLFVLFIVTAAGGSSLVYMIIFLVPFMLYNLVCEIFFGGQSLGKLITAIKVIKIDGSVPTIGSYVIRWVFRTLDVALLLGTVAIISIITNGKGQRIGDVVAKTTVVRVRKKIFNKDTLYRTLPENYQPIFAEASQLKDKDVLVINEVLSKLYKQRSVTALHLTNKTKYMIEKTLGIESQLPSQHFLEAIIKDYTYYHTRNL